MFYFLFFFLQLIIADENADKNNESSLDEQINNNTQGNNLESSHLNQINSQKINPTHTPHKTLQRIKETQNIPKFTPEGESTTIGLEKKEIEQTPKINPLRRRNAKINIPKVELDEDETKSQNDETQHIPPNPDFDDKKAFNEDQSDPFDDEDDDKDDNNQNEKGNTDSNQITTTILSTEAPKETPLQSLFVEPTPTSTPIATPTKVPLFHEKEQKNDINTETNANDVLYTLESDKKTTTKKKMAKFHIVSISPRTVSTHGDEKIEITMNTTLDGPPFIKFGENKIIHGRHSKKDLTVKCRTPKLPEGDINISVSIDKVKWCEPYSIVVVADEADLPWIFVGCAGIAIIAVSLLVSKLICGKRAVPKKKKSSQSRNDDIMNILAPNYRSNSLHKRTKTPIEV